MYSGWRVQVQRAAYALGHLVIGARSVPTHAQSAHASFASVQGNAAAKRDGSAAHLTQTTLGLGRGETLGTKRIGRSDAEQRMARLAECVQACGRERYGVRTEGVGRIGLGFGNGLTTWPGLRGVWHGDGDGAQDARTVDHCGPFGFAAGESSHFKLARYQLQIALQLLGTGHFVASVDDACARRAVGIGRKRAVIVRVAVRFALTTDTGGEHEEREKCCRLHVSAPQATAVRAASCERTEVARGALLDRDQVRPRSARRSAPQTGRKFAATEYDTAIQKLIVPGLELA
jgi:hypothetical protein